MDPVPRQVSEKIVNDLKDKFEEMVLEGLRAQQESWRSTFDELRSQLESARREIEAYRKVNRELRTEIDQQKALRKTERVRLVAWLNRRIEQQEEAFGRAYVSEETKGILEIEVNLLKRYREILVENRHSSNEDPTMPRFE